MPHRLLRPSWLVRHAFALLIFGTLIRLGFWQLDRLEERRAENAARIAVLDQQPVDLGSDADTRLVGQRAVVWGTYLNEQSVLLRGQKSSSGVEGVHLLTPLQIRGTNVAIMVDRGWLLAEQARPALRSAFAIEREVRVEGVVMAGQARPDALLAGMDLPLPGETRIDAWLRVDLAKMQNQMPLPLLPIYLVQLPTPDAPRLPLPEDPRLLNEGSHLSYALQWFAFALILLIVYAGLMRQELRR
nr:SURF1 family protein [Oscillochloris trichoides]